VKTLITLGIGVLANPIRGEDRYYVMVFGQASEPSRVRNSHTFALFVKASGKSSTDKIETQCISWMPADGIIKPFGRDPEPGKNMTREESFTVAASLGAKVTMWGPFPIKKELYETASTQIDNLKAGKMKYMVVDATWRGKGASNCIHAIADLDPSQVALNTGAEFGPMASAMVVSHLEVHFLLSRASNRWLVDRLDLSTAVAKFVNSDLVAR
jgi:hypothetical protein